MRMTVAAFALALALCVADAAPSPVLAQDYLGAHLQAQRHDNLRRHQQRIVKKRQMQRSGMTPHQRACARRYRSYDPRTDRYAVRAGVTARCRL